MFRRALLQLTFLCSFAVAAAAQTLPPTGDFGQSTPGVPLVKVPNDVILVKGAAPSASDHSTPLPEEGGVVKNVFQNKYLGISYQLPDGWTEAVKGPPPSDSGAYVLAMLVPSATFSGPTKGTVLFTAQDMFFGYAPVNSAKELIAYRRKHLESYYDVERQPTEITIGDHTFARFDYMSSVAQLHWVVLATQIRCHALQFVFSSRDPKLLESLVADLGRMTLPAEAGDTAGKGGGETPLCIRDYAGGDRLLSTVDPDLTDHRFNPIPVRIIIDKRGKVRHVHVLSAFPEQATKITNALLQWQFKPYMKDGKALEVETGIMFGHAPNIKRQQQTTASSIGE